MTNGMTDNGLNGAWRTGRWLVALLVLIGALAVLLPLAVDAVRAVVALTD